MNRYLVDCRLGHNCRCNRGLFFDIVVCGAVFLIITRTAISTLACLRLFLGLGHMRNLGNGFVTINDEVAQHCIIETERTDQFIQCLFLAFDVEQKIMRLVDLFDGVRKLAAPPVFLAVDMTTVGLDH